MTLVSVALVGKDNEPLYLRDFIERGVRETGGNKSENVETGGSQGKSPVTVEGGDPFGFFTATNPTNESASLRQQFLVHAALDRFEELTGPDSNNRWRSPGAFGSDAMWVGLLCPIEEFRVFGYLTNTNIKFMAVIEDTDGLGHQPTTELKTLFAALHDLYVQHTLNPFSSINAKISSRRFDEGVSSCVHAFNAGRVPKENWV